MDLPRFHLDAPLTVGLCAELSLAEAHHAMHVLRLRVGDALELFDGRGQSATARIAQAKHGRVRCEVEAVGAVRARPEPRVHLAFAVPKGKRLDWLLEKATELASSSLRPVAFERGVAGDDLADGKRERWLTHCVAAAKQSGLNFLPELRERQTLPDLLADAAGAGAGVSGAGTLFRLVGDVTADAVSLPDALGKAGGADPPVTDILLIIGPEGGLSDVERNQLAAAHVTPVRLGHTILRIETAAVALLAAVTALAR